MYQDKTIVCKDCGMEFVFTAGEQEFYAEKGYTNEPSRCRSCRNKKKNQRTTAAPQREWHEATCAECGAPTQVPFKPSTDKPVYCKACYDARRR